jgi:O-antigen ligase
MSKVAFVTLWVFVFVIPWEDAVRITGFGSIGRIAGAVALGATLARVMIAQRIRPLSWFLLFALIFLLWSALTLFWAVDAVDTQTRVLTYVQLTASVWVIWEVAPWRERQLKLLQAYVLGAYVLVATTLMNYFAGIAITPNSVRFAGLGDNPNELGFAVALALPVAWYLALDRPGGLVAWLNRLFVPLGMTTILLTASRGALIPALVALLLIPWTLSRLRLRAKVAACVLGIVGLLLVQQLVPEQSWQRLATTSEAIETGTFGGRGTIWRAGLEVFTQHPLVGVGAGGFNVAVQPVLGYRMPPHQTFLSVLVGQGIVGLLLFGGMFGAAMTSLRVMGSLQRKFWLVMLLTLGIGLMPRTWDYRKPVWLFLGLLASHTAVVPITRSLQRRQAAAERDPTLSRESGDSEPHAQRARYCGPAKQLGGSQRIPNEAGAKASIYAQPPNTPL